MSNYRPEVEPTWPPKAKTLQQMLVGAQFVADRASLEVEPAFEDMVRDELCYRLRSYVLADHLAADEYKTTVERTPTSWWQHLKRDHAPRWLKRRWPVRAERLTVTVKVDRYLTYPDAAIRTPDLGRAYILEQVSDTRE